MKRDGGVQNQERKVGKVPEPYLTNDARAGENYKARVGGDYGGTKFHIGKRRAGFLQVLRRGVGTGEKKSGRGLTVFDSTGGGVGGGISSGFNRD